MATEAVRIAQLEAALRPFAAVTLSSLHDDFDDEGYSVVLTAGKNDFTRLDVLRARAALKSTV